VSGVSYLTTFFCDREANILLPASSSITALVETLKPASYPSSKSKSTGQIGHPLN
jgi:hypothetical protein